MHAFTWCLTASHKTQCSAAGPSTHRAHFPERQHSSDCTAMSCGGQTSHASRSTSCGCSTPGQVCSFLVTLLISFLATHLVLYIWTDSPVLSAMHSHSNKPNCSRHLAGTCRSSSAVARETSCVITNGPHASQEQAACIQQPDKSLSQTAPAQAALPQHKLQVAQQKTQKRKAARGLAALDYAVSDVQVTTDLRFNS